MDHDPIVLGGVQRVNKKMVPPAKSLQCSYTTRDNGWMQMGATRTTPLGHTVLKKPAALCSMT